MIEAGITNPPAAATRGGTISVTDTTKNQGLISASASTTQYYLSLNQQKTGAILLTGSRSVPALTSTGNTSTSKGTVTVTIPAATSVGTYFLLACADDLNAVGESSETNNCIASTSTINVK